MATYAIGDIQGCLDPLKKLLDHIQFNSAQDLLWFTGDLVNRGPKSLATLRFIKQLGPQHKIVLGNHDLHLLARAHHAHSGWKDDTIEEVLLAPDRDELLHWLYQQPLLHYDKNLNFALVHAGLAPSWNIETAQALAHEVTDILKSDKRHELFQHMYGNEPAAWSENLTGWERIRCIINYFTRVRFCHKDGGLELKTKGKIDLQHDDLIPWFQLPNRATANTKIIFGHWAALGGVTNTPNTYALDTGCIWGYALTALRLEDEQRFAVECDQPKTTR